MSQGEGATTPKQAANDPAGALPTLCPEPEYGPCQTRCRSCGCDEAPFMRDAFLCDAGKDLSGSVSSLQFEGATFFWPLYQASQSGFRTELHAQDCSSTKQDNARLEWPALKLHTQEPLCAPVHAFRIQTTDESMVPLLINCWPSARVPVTSASILWRQPHMEHTTYTNL